MKKVSECIVSRRYLIMGIVLCLTVLSAFLALRVEINYDMSKYLPDRSPMKTGMRIMEEAFPAMDTGKTIRVMAEGLDGSEEAELQSALEAIPYVDSVAHDDSESYRKGNYSLFVITTSYDYGTREEKSIEKSLARDFGEYQILFQNDNMGVYDVPFWLLAGAVSLLVVILILMCESWLESILFLVNIGIAVLINLGTNIFQGEISAMTWTMASILQLVLSIDYSIMLSNRYRQEKSTGLAKEEAMAAAIRNCFSSVSGSALTTAAGMLALVFMNFRIGMDLGIVLAKGVLISLLCVLTLLPGIILCCDPLIGKTAKKTIRFPMGWAARFSYRLRYGLAVGFVLLFAGAFWLQGGTEISYHLENQDPIGEVFTPENMLVILYENGDEEKMGQLAESLEDRDGVTQVLGYPNLLGKQYTAEEMGNAISGLGSGLGNGLAGGLGGLPAGADEVSADADEAQDGTAGTDSLTAGVGLSFPPALLKLIYYHCYDGSSRPVGIGELIPFLTENILNNEDYAGLLEKYSGQASAGGLGFLTGQTDPEVMELLYLLYAAEKNYRPEWTMSIPQLVGYVNESLLTDPRFETFVDEDMRRMAADAGEMLESGAAMLKSDRYSRMILRTTLPVESEATTELMDELTDAGRRMEGEYYLIGNSAMSYEMRQSFGRELLTITLLTAAAIFLIVLITSRSVIIPALLVLIVQCGVFITVTVVGWQGYQIYFLALLIVECILMGATIDYGILFAGYYREKRREMGVQEALEAAYDGSIHTIMTSGLIITIVTGILGYTYSDPTVAEICRTISTGALCAILLILFVLPGMLAAFDRIVVRPGRGGYTR